MRATPLNNKMIATGTPRTSRSAFPFEIQQNTLASEGEINTIKTKNKNKTKTKQKPKKKKPFALIKH